MLDIAFAHPILPASGALALLVPEGAELAGVAAAVDAATDGMLSQAFAAANFTGKKASSCTLLAPGAGLSRIVAIGVGKHDELTPYAIEEAGGAAAAALASETDAALAADGLEPAHAAAAPLGAGLRSYRFDRYRPKEK